MKTITRTFLCIMLFQFSLMAFSIDNVSQDTTNFPKKALIISIYYNALEIIYTMIDQSNDEMVIVCYSTDYAGTIKTLGLKKIIRTGIIIDTVEQKKLFLNSQALQNNKN
jgi:hypothetical protein